MTRKVDLPSIEQIERAKASMLADAHETGRRATVTALAKLLNLSNATFWRYFPDTARDIAANGRAERAEPKSTNKVQQLEEQVATLKRANRETDAHLQIAVANIQRLAIENQQLREQLESLSNVHRIDRLHR
jgi:AcrR family transcriptional regulator